MKNSVSSVLWDIDESVRQSLPRDFVVQRVLSYGTIGLIVQIIREHGVTYVRDIFLKLKPSSIPGKKYLYLKNYLIK